MQHKVANIVLLFFTFWVQFGIDVTFGFEEYHFNLSQKHHCQYRVSNSTFATCNDGNTQYFSIYIVNNHLENFNFKTSNFRELRSLGLADLKKSVSGEIFKKFPNLESLKVMGYPDNNRIEVLPDLSFLSQLKSLNLYNNNLGKSWDSQLVKDSDYKSRMDCQQLLPVSVDYLDLVANEISYLPNWIANLINLTYLNLDYNELTFIPHGLFRNMKSLRYLFLSMNRLVNIENSLPLDSLHRLDIKMQRNQIPLRVDDFAFDVQRTDQPSDDYEEHVIDLRTEPEQLNFQNRALCTIPGRFAGRRKLLVLNAKYNSCILKQFDGTIEMYDLQRGVFTLSSTQINYNQCGTNSDNSECLEVERCDYKYSCYEQTKRITPTTTTTTATTNEFKASFRTTTESTNSFKSTTRVTMFTAEINPFLDQIRARNNQQLRSSTSALAESTKSEMAELVFDLNVTKSSLNATTVGSSTKAKQLLKNNAPLVLSHYSKCVLISLSCLFMSV